MICPMLAFQKPTGKNFLLICLGYVWHLYGRSLLGSLLLSSVSTKIPTLTEVTVCLFVTAPYRPRATAEVSVPLPVHGFFLNGSLKCPEIIPNTKQPPGQF